MDSPNNELEKDGNDGFNAKDKAEDDWILAEVEREEIVVVDVNDIVSLLLVVMGTSVLFLSKSFFSAKDVEDLLVSFCLNRVPLKVKDGLATEMGAVVVMFSCCGSLKENVGTIVGDEFCCD